MHEVVLGMQEVLREFGPDKMMIGEASRRPRAQHLPPACSAHIWHTSRHRPPPRCCAQVYADKLVSEADVMSYYGTQAAPQFSMPFNFELVRPAARDSISCSLLLTRSL